MDKLKVMEQMSQRIDSKCKDHDSCYNCILHEYKLDDNDVWCGDYSSVEDYKMLVHKCKLLNIDISDLLIEEPLTTCKTDTKFTVNDIKPGFLLQVIDTIADEEIICIGIQNEDNIYFYGGMDTNLSFEKLFCINDIASDFNIKNNHYSVTKIYGYINKPDSCNIFGTRNRPLLWSRSDKTYLIQNGEQIIYIAPNEKEYRDGNVYIEDKTDENAYISISPANLSDLISILQEIYIKYYKE